ncbi:uncharacterized protein LOC123911429 [Trifolium pratense]|uniref:Uncharacterized protein n=1 Tax=Trifolium pratense TaxID=57577 RepID=A0ACB0LE31_TRIPR|nr:uncharacterized protein LOC123911429 [Trifolium pratense]CAJ2667025.1 unnamed protein product [Trifolium pratense]
MTFCRFNPAMTMRIAILREARRKFDSILGLNRLIHSVPHSQSQSPPLAGSIYHGLNSFCFGGSLELMAVPKRKTSPHKRGIRNGPKALKPVPVLVLCKGCGRVRLPHFYCCSGKPHHENNGGQNGTI